MKIGILTFHYAHNCGASLQAFALKEYLKSKGQDVSIVNYRNEKIYNLYPKRLKVKFIPYDFKHPKELGKKIKLKCDYRYGRREWKQQYKKFDSFIDKFLLDGNDEPIRKDEIGGLNYDVFVAGSDQIWNSHLTGGLDDVYLLNFDTNAHKFFYAPSSGSDEINKKELPAFESVFANKYVSAREPSLAAFLSNQFKRNVPSVVDPCFLLSAPDYVKMFSLNASNGLPKKKYLFAYFISERNKRIREMVYVIANALNLEIVEFHYRKDRDMNKKYQTGDMGPAEFLKYIYNADFIVTNSFHGTVFSIMFNKQFYSVYEEDARKENLLKATGLSDRHIKTFSEIDLNKHADFKDVDLNKFAKSSKDFLDNMVDEYEKR